MVELRHYRLLCQHSIHTGDTVGITASILLETPVRLFVKETQVSGLDYKYTKLIILILILTAATSSKYKMGKLIIKKEVVRNTISFFVKRNSIGSTFQVQNMSRVQHTHPNRHLLVKQRYLIKVG